MRSKKEAEHLYSSKYFPSCSPEQAEGEDGHTASRKERPWGYWHGSAEVSWECILIHQALVLQCWPLTAASSPRQTGQGTTWASFSFFQCPSPFTLANSTTCKLFHSSLLQLAMHFLNSKWWKCVWVSSLMNELLSEWSKAGPLFVKYQSSHFLCEDSISGFVYN